jgi:hypothetical protein
MHDTYYVVAHLDDFTEIVSVYGTMISNEVTAMQVNLFKKTNKEVSHYNPLMKSLIKNLNLSCHEGYKRNIANARLFSDEAKRENAPSSMESQANSLERYKDIKVQKLKLDAHLQSEESETLLELSESSKTESKSKKILSSENDNLLSNSDFEILDSKTTKTNLILNKLRNYSTKNLIAEIKSC